VHLLKRANYGETGRTFYAGCTCFIFERVAVSLDAAVGRPCCLGFHEGETGTGGGRLEYRPSSLSTSPGPQPRQHGSTTLSSNST
jgi:hypothetical protein